MLHYVMLKCFIKRGFLLKKIQVYILYKTLAISYNMYIQIMKTKFNITHRIGLFSLDTGYLNILNKNNIPKIKYDVKKIFKYNV